MPDYDVAIVGAGPAGSTTAYHLTKAGARVLLVDRAKFPRDKPCGGGVTVRAFAEAPVDLTPVVEQVVTKVRFSFRLGAFFDYAAPRTLVHMTQRHRLDAYLAQQAAVAGTEFADASIVRDITFDEDGIHLRANGTAVQARLVVGADGANGVVARAAGLSPVHDPPVALEANFPYANGHGAPPGWRDILGLELGSMAGGYGWNFPKADHFNVGCGGWRSEGSRLRDHLGALQRHYGLDAAAMENVRGHHLPTRRAGAPIVDGRTLLVGDAAGLVDPMSGEGIYAAFVSGRLAAAAALRFLAGREANLASYEAAIERELMPDIRAAELLRDAYHYTPRPCYEVMRRSAALQNALCQLITGEKTYAQLLRQFGPLQPLVRYWAHRGRQARRRASSTPAGRLKDADKSSSWQG
jgi:geranylgeranyl reductase family protein